MVVKFFIVINLYALICAHYSNDVVKHTDHFVCQHYLKKSGIASSVCESV